MYGSHFSFVKWQQMMIDAAKNGRGLSEFEMVRMVSPYPAGAIGLADKLVEELMPVLASEGTTPEDTVPPDERRTRGRRKKYSADSCERAQAEYDELYAKTNDSKGAWNTVAEHQGFPNGDAARAACYRLRAKRRKR
jgi:hypothetical protein